MLDTARRARNDLSHQGKPPSEGDAKSAYQGVCRLLSVVLNGERPPFFDLDLDNHALSDPLVPKKLRGEPDFWMEIPKLPGEVELERAAKFAGKSDPSTGGST